MFIPYQIDHNVKNTAKTLGFSKKRVSFKFGLADRQSVDKGETGVGCRGSEHEVTFLWSLKTGKRQLFLDGKDVHFSESRQNGWTTDRAWQHSFTLHDRKDGAFKVHFISQPVNRDMPDVKPFDLRLNGVSYFAFNQIYQLGTPSMTVRESHSRGHHESGRDSPMGAEERRALAQAKVESMRDFQAQHARPRMDSANSGAASAMRREEESLLSFDDAPPVQQVAATHSASANSMTSSQGNGMYASNITLDTAIQDRSNSYGNMQGSFGSGGGYNSNPPGAAAYQYQAPPPVNVAAASTTTLAPYQMPGGVAPTPYVDSTGRLAMGTQPQPQGYNYATPTHSAGNASFQNQFQSPSNQSYASYGSAPSFAQPPRQQGAPDGFANGPPASSNPYGAPPQQQAYGLPPQQSYAPPQQQPNAGNYYAPPPQQGGYPAPSYPGY